MSPKVILTYLSLSLWSSFYIAWHYAMPLYNDDWLVGGVVLMLTFASFNSFWLMITSIRRKIVLSQKLYNIASLSLGFAFFLMLFFIISDFLLFIPVYANSYFEHPLIGALSITALAAILVLYAFLNSRHIRITAYEIMTPKKNVDFSLVLISDLHIDNCGIGLNQMSRIATKINKLNPDFTIFAGDIIESTPDHFCAKDFGTQFQKLNSKKGNLAIVGNHEYYGGKILENIIAMEDAGLTVLKDDRLDFDNLTIIGRDDKFVHHRCPLDKLLKGTPKDNFIMVLDHNPISIDDSVENQIDLQLSGHTHNGQVFPFNLVVKSIFKNGYGHKQIGDTHTIVSSGASTWGPALRLGTKAEIVHIHVKSK